MNLRGAFLGFAIAGAVAGPSKVQARIFGSYSDERAALEEQLANMPDISVGERNAFYFLLGHFNRKRGDAFPSGSEGARYLHKSIRTWRRYTAALEKKGAITKEKHPTYSSRLYRFPLYRRAADPTETPPDGEWYTPPTSSTDEEAQAAIAAAAARRRHEFEIEIGEYEAAQRSRPTSSSSRATSSTARPPSDPVDVLGALFLQAARDERARKYPATDPGYVSAEARHALGLGLAKLVDQAEAWSVKRGLDCDRDATARELAALVTRAWLATPGRDGSFLTVREHLLCFLRTDVAEHGPGAVQAWKLAEQARRPRPPSAIARTAPPSEPPPTREAVARGFRGLLAKLDAPPVRASAVLEEKPDLAPELAGAELRAAARTAPTSPALLDGPQVVDERPPTSS